jgi:NAD(P)-dependent dehydrogenase (short-subunit alcohol dehydrogenase family)
MTAQRPLLFFAYGIGETEGWNVPESQSALLDALGRLYLANAPVAWTAFHAGGDRGRVPLPTYPFERQRYWVDARRATAAQPARIGKRANLETWTYVPSWRRAPAARRAAEVGAVRWLIFCDASGVGRRLAQDLARSGHSVVTVEVQGRYAQTASQAYAIDPRNPSDYMRLLDALGAEIPAQIVHLWSVDAAGGAPVSELISRGSRSLLYLAQAIAQSSWAQPLTLTVVGSEAQDVPGDEPIVPAKATVLAPVIGIPQELPSVTCRYLDVEPPSLAATNAAQLSDRILAEALGGAAENAIAYRGRHRWIHGYQPFAVPASSACGLRRGGVYLITGGLGSLGLVLAEHLARTYQAKLILTSRSGRADQPTLRTLEQLGAEVMVAVADVADAEQMRAVVQQIAGRFGQLHGVIHAAGLVQGDAFPAISRCTPEQWEAQLRPKVSGTLVLADVLPEGLDFCVVFSSLASGLGGQGLCPYAAANLFMDGFVQEHNRVRRPGSTPWLSVNWDYWQTAAAHRAEALGSTLFRATDAGRAELGITADEGVEVFERLVSPRGSAVSQILVATGDLEARVARWVHRSSPLRSSEPSELARLRAETVVPIAADESLRSPHDLEKLAAEHAIDVAVLKLARLGGPRPTLALARRAGELGLRVVLTDSIDTMIGCAAVLHVASALSAPVWLEFKHSLLATLQGFHTDNPDLPGIGLERLRMQLGPRLPSPLFQSILQGLARVKVVALDGAWVRLAGHELRLRTAHHIARHDLSGVVLDPHGDDAAVQAVDRR